MTSNLYLILGAAIDGLYRAGERPEDILQAATEALRYSQAPDPALVEAGRTFAQTLSTANQSR